MFDSMIKETRKRNNTWSIETEAAFTVLELCISDILYLILRNCRSYYSDRNDL